MLYLRSLEDENCRILTGGYEPDDEQLQNGCFVAPTVIADIDHDGDVTTATADGSPSGEIIDYLDDHDIDQVVVGGRRRSPAGKAIFGSTAQKVTLSAPCPVTIVH